MTQTFTPSRPVPPLPGASLLGLKSTSLLELGDAVEGGLPTAALERYAEHLGLPVSGLLELIGLSPSTYFGHKKKGKTLSTETGAQLYHLARVTDAAEHYFEDVSAAHAWLKARRQSLGGRTPLQFALLPAGAEYVITLLGRLEHGVYS